MARVVARWPNELPRLDSAIAWRARRHNDTPTVDDPELLARLRLGDESAFATLFREHYPGLVLSATRILRERALAEEIAQEVMLELWRRRADASITSSVKGYLHRAARNRALNRVRQDRTAQRAEPFLRPPTSAPQADELARGREIAAAAREAIAQLSTPQREVFEMSRTDGLTYPEIAEALQISVKTVEARMGRALKQLREALAGWLPTGSGW